MIENDLHLVKLKRLVKAKPEKIKFDENFQTNLKRRENGVP